MSVDLIDPVFSDVMDRKEHGPVTWLGVMPCSWEGGEAHFASGTTRTGAHAVPVPSCAYHHRFVMGDIEVSPSGL
jgi:hypothetical protein